MDGASQDVLIGALRGSLGDTQALTQAERALLAYADVLTLRPAEVGHAEVDALRAAGYDDRAIHDACAIIGYFAFVNRIADGLGVQLEREIP